MHCDGCREFKEEVKCEGGVCAGVQECTLIPCTVYKYKFCMAALFPCRVLEAQAAAAAAAAAAASPNSSSAVKESTRGMMLDFLP